jgi:hypothetical protein
MLISQNLIFYVMGQQEVPNLFVIALPEALGAAKTYQGKYTYHFCCMQIESRSVLAQKTADEFLIR